MNKIREFKWGGKTLVPSDDIDFEYNIETTFFEHQPIKIRCNGVGKNFKLDDIIEIKYFEKEIKGKIISIESDKLTLAPDKETLEYLNKLKLEGE